MNACIRSFATALLLATAQAALGQSSTPMPSTVGSVAEGDVWEGLARQKADALIPTCRFEGARCGYIDRDGNTVVAPQFDWADRFVDGRALVGIGGKYGAIDSTGHFAIAPAYESISQFDRGLALVIVGNRLGVMDRNGQLVVPAEHGAIIRISDEAFLVAEPPYFRPDVQPSWIVPAYVYGKRWGVIASGGRWVVRPTFAEVMKTTTENFNGLFWASDSASGGARWWLTGADGAPVSMESFDHVQIFPAGQDRAIVQRNGRWGAINSKGQIAVELKFDGLSYFREGWAPYRLAGREGRIDKDGNVLSDMPAARPSNPGDANVGSVVDGKPLYIDRARTTLFGTDHPACADGRHLRFEQGRWTIVTADNQPVPDVSFQYVDLVCNGPSVVKRDGKWGFIAVDGKLLAGRYFDWAHGFHEGIAAVIDGGLWSLMAEDGSVLLGPLKLARGMTTNGGGEYSIEFDEGFKKLDKALIAELMRNPDVLTRRLVPRGQWSEGLAAQFDDKIGKWGFVGPMKDFMIAPQFDAVSPFNKGVAWAAIPERREWCVIDKAGQIKPDTQCRCEQPLVIIEHYSRPSNLDCYDDGIRIMRGEPVIRGTAN